MAKKKAKRILRILVPLTPAYSNKYVTIRATTLQLNIPLKNGVHTFTSELVDVGELRFFKDPVLQAQITIWYDYNHKLNEIKLCSNELISDDSPYLTTVPRGTSQFGYQTPFKDIRNPCGNNPHWNYATPLMPGLEEAFRHTLRTANTLILDKAKKERLSVLTRTPFPDVEPELYENLMLVFKKGKFVEHYDPSKNYSNKYEIIHAYSQWGGLGELEYGEHFANIDGSSDDPHPTGKGYRSGDSWIDFWERNYEKAQYCATKNFYSGEKNFKCIKNPKKPPKKGLLGGHCLRGEKAEKGKGSKKVLFIIPICPRHNSKKRDHGYFEATEEQRYVWLTNYGGEIIRQ
jgi:hypothetical protein